MLNSVFHLTYTDSGTAPAGIPAASEGEQGVSLKGKNAVETTPVVSLSVPFKTFKRERGLTP